MSIGKIILTSFIVIVAIGVVSFAVMLPTFDEKTSPEIINEQKQESVEPVSIATDPQITPEIKEKTIPPYTLREKQCTGDAKCINGFVTRVIDGDTIIVDGQSIRFALVNTPEYGQYDYSQARAYIETICPIGSKVLIDEDDGQTEGSHGRIIAKIYCNELNLNEEILEVGHAEILPEFCSVSEFAEESWVKKHGC
ncbi:MAG: thermonuclease family protein [Nitrosopumilus sp.]|nr:thermonuclease family protein [Nitrosopumilus sp.]